MEILQILCEKYKTERTCDILRRISLRSDDNLGTFNKLYTIFRIFLEEYFYKWMFMYKIGAYYYGNSCLTLYFLT